MVSTYLAYNSIVRNLRQSMTHVAQQTDVSRNAAYYKDNIGKVKTVDDFLKNDRLYQYAMKAYDLRQGLHEEGAAERSQGSKQLRQQTGRQALSGVRRGVLLRRLGGGHCAIGQPDR